MKTLTLYVSIPSYQNDQVEILRALMGAMVGKMQQAKITCSLEEGVYGDRYFFECRHSNEAEEQLCKKLSQLLTDYFFTHVVKKIIHKLIETLYESSYPHDIEEIEERIYQHFDNQARDDYIVCRQKITQQIQYFLAENLHLAIDGYVHFRTKPFQKWLSKYVQQAIDEYLLDREYKEFIELLKYFVSIQKSKFVCVHVIHQARKRFRLLKDDGTPIEAGELDGTFHEMIGQSFSGEDFVVGALLSTAPEQVVLHTSTPDENVIRTLLQIFGERITICPGCKTCLSGH